MADQDFTDGFDRGKRAVTKAAGWVAGVGAAAVSPIARAAETKRQAAELKRQEEERARLVHQQRTVELKRQAGEATLRPLSIVHVLSTIALAMFLAVFASLSPSPDRWMGEAAAFVIGVALGALITWLTRSRDIIRARHLLHKHALNGDAPYSVGGLLFFTILFMAIIVAITKKFS